MELSDELKQSQGDVNSGHAVLPVTSKMIDDLRAVVEHGRRHWKAMILLEATGFVFSVSLGYLWLVILLDDALHLGVWGRVLANILLLAGVAALARHLFRSWRRTRLTEDQVALAIEDRTQGGLQNRLINAIQLSRESKSLGAPTSRAVVEENYSYLHRTHLEQSRQSRPAMICMGMALLLALGGLALWTWGGERFMRSATRVLLPLADVAPVYRTRITVTPGDMRASIGDSVDVTISVEGSVPYTLMILTRKNEQQSSRRVQVPPGSRHVSITFDSLQNSLSYAVRGGDFVTRFYRIDVTKPVEIERATATYRYPSYTRLFERRVDSATGDFEALLDTKANLIFTFNQSIKEVFMLLAGAEPALDSVEVNTSSATAPIQRVALAKRGPNTFTGEVAFRDVTGYTLECTTARGEIMSTARARLRVLPDRSPQLSLIGLADKANVATDAVLPVTLHAQDDIGLTEVGLFYRLASHLDDLLVSDANQWVGLKTWAVSPSTQDFSGEHFVALGAVDAADGASIHVAVRACDTDPGKQGRWTTGSHHTLTLSSPGGELHLVYEQILRTEDEMRKLMAAHEDLVDAAAKWLAKLDFSSGLRWDDRENIDALAKAMGEQAARQSQLRDGGTRLARAMAVEAGETLRISIGMLSDTEMVRSIRILEKVARRETPQEMRIALSDARLTQQRIVRSLGVIIRKHAEFRMNWELSHMVGYTEALARRQKRMADSSVSYASLKDAESVLNRKTITVRQMKLVQLSDLAQTAFAGLASRAPEVGELLAAAYQSATEAYAAQDLKPAMKEAAGLLEAGRWNAAAPHQYAAGSALEAICRDLRRAQTLAAREALAALQELALTSVEAQRELEALELGTDENLIESLEGLDLSEVVHYQALVEELKRKHELDTDKAVEDYMFEDDLLAWVTTPNNVKVDVNTLKLGEKPTGDGASYPNSTDRDANATPTSIQEQFEDLVGDLLQEADDLREDYETYNINTAWGCADAGVVGKSAGDINGTGATSTTGNMKPPTMNVGGASRSGRLGARAHGLVVGDEYANRRGRDEAQEGQQNVADQAGKMHETLSSDPQVDTSTGSGGKAVKSEQTAFSVKDAGEWQDKTVDKMGAPQRANQIVERKGKPLDARIAEMMYDLEGSQEQVIERIKAIQKELDRLYLPTDHLDEIMAQLKANLDQLGALPDMDIFRQQFELLDKLRSTVVVFDSPASDYEQSVRREQVIRSRILDEPPAPPIPGYEDTVSRYYEKLSGLQSTRR